MTLPHINITVNVIAKYEMLSIMNAFFGYNQIQMNFEYEERLPHDGSGYLLLQDKPFGLKNVGSTYLQLVNRMFKHVIRKFMDVYINDMLIQYLKTHEHIKHLGKAFDILK